MSTEPKDDTLLDPASVKRLLHRLDNDACADRDLAYAAALIRRMQVRLQAAEKVCEEVQTFQDDDGDGTTNIWRGINKSMKAWRALAKGRE